MILISNCISSNIFKIIIKRNINDIDIINNLPNNEIIIIADENIHFKKLLYNINDLDFNNFIYKVDINKKIYHIFKKPLKNQKIVIIANIFDLDIDENLDVNNNKIFYSDLVKLRNNNKNIILQNKILMGSEIFKNNIYWEPMFKYELKPKISNEYYNFYEIIKFVDIIYKKNNILKLFDNMTIYINENDIDDFLIKNNFGNNLILITESLTYNQYCIIKKNNNFKTIITLNNNYNNNNDCLQICYGIDYSCINNNKNYSIKLLDNFLEKSLIIKKQNSIYYNENILIINLNNYNLIKNDENNLIKIIYNMINYKFVLTGNKYLWIALALGCIPIVKTSPLDSLYDDLPILIVKEWSDVTQELLNKTIEEYKTKQFNLEKLKLNYWIEKINSYKS